MQNQIMNRQIAVVFLGIITTVSLLVIVNQMIGTSGDIIDTAARTGVMRNADWTSIVGDTGYMREFDGMMMVLVPTGCFSMGNDPDAYHWDGMRYSQGVPDGGEQCIDAPFWIDETEVTQADFARLGGQQATSSHFEGDSRPVNRIIWQEAHDFCIARGGRLPTEAEWEYVARGPDNLFFPWGNEWIPTHT
ncbi:MAG: SUMF1/EgtB/PvdO family nonheme iron enzyme, partial [Chloroflexota bacterium]